MLIGFKFYCWKFLDPVLDYYIPDAENADPASPPVTVHQDVGRHKLRNRFGHPAWTQQLIKPIVHAKAKHLLPTVCHGRINGDEEQGYGSQMGGGIGKVEVVQEQDLDYNHFRVKPFHETMGNCRIVRTLTLRV